MAGYSGPFPSRSAGSESHPGTGGPRGGGPPGTAAGTGVAPSAARAVPVDDGAAPGGYPVLALSGNDAGEGGARANVQDQHGEGRRITAGRRARAAGPAVRPVRAADHGGPR